MAEAIVQEATPKKVAFMTKPKNVEERIKKDEKELEKLLEEQKKMLNKIQSLRLKLMILQSQTVLRNVVLKSVMAIYENINNNSKKLLKIKLQVLKDSLVKLLRKK